jgi:hypothetical protein
MKFIKNTQAGKSSISIYILKRRRHLKKQYNLKIKKERQAAN